MERVMLDAKVEKTDCLQDQNLVNRCYEYDRMEHLSRGGKEEKEEQKEQGKEEKCNNADQKVFSKEEKEKERPDVSTVEWKKNDLSLEKAILYTYRACYSLYLKSKPRMCF